MIAAFDVHYLEGGRASAAAVLFRAYADAVPAVEYVELVEGVSPYVPGEFYRRELPCILGLLEQMDETPDEMLIDGYVMLGDRPGLGMHLFEHFAGKIPVIGVAKSKYRGASAEEVFRGRSVRPLYVTSAGVDIREASRRVGAMHGTHRVPTLLRRVDLLARERTQRDAGLPGRRVLRARAD